MCLFLRLYVSVSIPGQGTHAFQLKQEALKPCNTLQHTQERLVNEEAILLCVPVSMSVCKSQFSDK